MSLGNTELIQYGIAEDESDYRMHMALGDGRAYLFSTEAGRQVLQNGKEYKAFGASQPGTNLITGQGYKVPWQDIEGCQELEIPDDLMAIIRRRLTTKDTTSRKGKAAVYVARNMLMRGLVPLELAVKEITEHDMQLKGKDMIITARLSMQIKCDWWATRYGLAIQTHECNPLGRY